MLTHFILDSSYFTIVWGYGGYEMDLANTYTHVQTTPLHYITFAITTTETISRSWMRWDVKFEEIMVEIVSNYVMI